MNETLINYLIGFFIVHSPRSPDAFTDLHKVEGMNGIYIATHVVSLPESNILPEHLVTLITYDRGGEWHYLQPPTKDDSGQPIDCDKVFRFLSS